MKFYYINTAGQRINFYGYPYLLQNCDFLDFGYKYSKKELSGRNYIQSLRREPEERSIEIAVMPDSALNGHRRAAYIQSINALVEVLDYDVAHNTCGRLYAESGQYVECMIIGSQKSHWYHGGTFMMNKMAVLIPNPAWMEEDKTEYYAGGITSEAAFLDYPHDYNYDYAQLAGTDVLITDHYAPSDFELIIYGPCTNPVINIGGNSYAVYYSVSKNEHILINSIDRTVTLQKANGTTKNLFDYREKRQSIFEKIPSGEHEVTWSGQFGFTIILHKERSEPRW